MRPRAGVPVLCPVCGWRLGTLSGLRSHLKYEHTGLSIRDRSLAAAVARRATGAWCEVRT